MRRIVYEVEMVKKEQPDAAKLDHEKRSLALRLINNASVLSEAAATFKAVLEKNPDSNLKSAVAKVDKVIEELRVDFKKNYKL
jgi:hypothetical protein